MMQIARSFILLILFSFFIADSFPINRERLDDLVNAAIIFKETLEYDKALNILESIPKNNRSSDVKKLLARLYYLNGNSKNALDTFNDIRDKDWWIYIYEGLIYEEMGDTRAAISGYLKSLQKNENSLALYRIGKIYYTKKNYSKAAEYFRDLIAFDPSFRLAYYYLGQSLLKSDRYEDSYKYLSKAIQFYPDNAQVKELLKVVKNKLGKDFFLARQKRLSEQRVKIDLVAYKRDVTSPLVRVGIGQDLLGVVIRCGGDFEFSNGKKSHTGKADKFYSITFKADRFVIADYNSKQIEFELTSPLEIKGKNRPFQVLDLISGKDNYWQSTMDRIYRGDFRLIVKNNKITLINLLSMEDYLYGVLPAEIPRYAPLQALMAQAVAARTIAINNMGSYESQGFDICADVRCQVYNGILAEDPQTNKAVKMTKGEAILYEGAPIEAFFHANCGGCLRADAFNKRDYLVTKFDSEKVFNKPTAYKEEMWFFDEPAVFSRKGTKSKFRWQRIYDGEDFAFVFGRDIEDIENMSPLKKGDCFHYEEMEIITPNERVVISGGLNIRKHFEGLRSSAFKFEVKSSAEKPAMLIFWGSGFGHGAGLSQEGAMEMANQGYTYKEILKHYYPNTQIETVY